MKRTFGFVYVCFILSQAFGYLISPPASAECRHCVDYTPQAIVLPAAQADDAGLQYAAKYLAQTMGELYASEPAVVSDADSDFASGTQGIVVAGANNSLVRRFGLKPLLADKPLADEAHHIAAGTLSGAGNHVIVVDGGGIRGLIFGLTYLAERLRINPHSVFDISTARSPWFKLRIMSGDSSETALRLGYNTVFTPYSSSEIVTLERYEKDFLNKYDERRDSLMLRRKDTTAALKRDKGYHLDDISMSDEFEFSRALLKKPYASKLLRDNKSDFLCFCAPGMWDLYDAKYDELMLDFPQTDYAMIRLGENYSKGDYFGTIIAKKDFWDDCPKCQSISYSKRIAELINQTWGVVVGKHGGKYIHRSWDTNSDTFHSNPDVYLDILSQIKNEDRFFISVKYTKTDFWRYNEYNQTIGIGDVPQVIEHQCTREYEGKGAYPNFIGRQLADAYVYERDHNAAGVWNWNHGGGWNGPFVQSDIWNDANIYAAAHLAWNPEIPAETLAREWAAITVGTENADKMTKLLLMSDDAVLKMVYFKAYAEKKGNPWMPNENWVRDDVIAGGDRLRTIYEKAKDSVAEMVQEKEDAVGIITDMYAVALDLALPKDKKDPIVNSVQYELVLAETLRSYAGAYFYYCRWLDTGSPSDRLEAERFAKKWIVDWQHYSDEIPKLAGVATNYSGDAMAKTMKEIKDDLDSRQ